MIATRGSGDRGGSLWPDQNRAPPYRDPGGRVPGHAAPGPGRRPGRPAAGPSAEEARRAASERNLFGVEFPWASGAVTAEGKTFQGVGLRYAGNASYMASAGGLKRSFLVDLDRADHAEFHGLHAMQLQSGALDPTKAREALAFALFREAGVPAPRTALAEVTLTVPGEHQKAYLGLYTLVEPVDRAFLKDRFGTDKGLLLRPQGLRGLDFLGDDWEKYRGPYRPLAEPTPDEARRLIEFVRLVQRGNDEQFRKEIASYLDVDKFLRFMAVQALIANADGFFTLAYNYSLFLDPNTNRFVFIPGDQELSFANFLMMGSADQLMDMSLARPYGGQNRLADRLLAINGRERGPSEDRQGSGDDRLPQGSPPGRCRGVRGRHESHPRTRGRGAGRACGAARRLRPAGGSGGPRPADLRREAVALDRRSARRQEGRLSPAIQFRAPGRGCPAEAGR